MRPHASGRRRTTILRLDEMFSLHFDYAVPFFLFVVVVDFTQSFTLSSRVWLCWKDMKMRSNVWRGHLQGICWPHVAETRASGCGKVCVKLQVCHHLRRVAWIHFTAGNQQPYCSVPKMISFPFVFHSGRRRRVRVRHRRKLSHTRCQACRVAPDPGGGSRSAPEWFKICGAIILPRTHHVFVQLLASASYDNNVCIYKEEDDDWECRATLQGHTSTVWGLSFDATGQRLASCSDDRTVKIWKEYPNESGQGELLVLNSVNPAMNLVINNMFYPSND